MFGDYGFCCHVFTVRDIGLLALIGSNLCFFLSDVFNANSYQLPQQSISLKLFSVKGVLSEAICVSIVRLNKALQSILKH